MTNRERVVNTLSFKSVDRLPMIEWAPWWDKTLNRWLGEGLSPGAELLKYWKLDDHRQFWTGSGGMEMQRIDGLDIYIREDADYERLLPYLYPEDAVLDNWREDVLREIKPAHDAGEFPVWLTLDGFFWWPRILWGIEPHLYSFYDHPALYHRICGDLADFHLRVIEDFCSVLTPDFMSFGEDMSYNHGPMLSEALFNEFLKPYYERVVPTLRERGIKVIVDTDGNVMPMIPWLLGCGVDGILPLERQSGVDAAALREKFPELIMIGAFDKTAMHKGEEAMRREFERLAPVMKTGGFIPSVDHQTPPDVSLENYGIYRRLLEEYCSKYHL